MNTNLTDFIQFCDKTLKQYTDKIKSDNNQDDLTLAKNMEHNSKLAQNYLKNGIPSIQAKARQILNNHKGDSLKLKKELEKTINEYIGRNTDFI
jgi:hypothetical protein